MTRVAAWLAAIAGVRYQIQNSAVRKMTGRQWNVKLKPPCVITWKTHSRKMREMARLRAMLSTSVASSRRGSTTFLSASRRSPLEGATRVVIDSAPPMRSGPSRSTVVGLVLLAFLVPGVRTARAQQTPAIEIAFPNQLVRGQTTLVHIAIPSREMFTGAEVSPATGVRVTGVTNFKRSELSQNVAWWDVTIEVASDAAPGPRTLVLLLPTGRTTPATLVIPNHVPRISDIGIAQASSPQTIDVQFSATDDSGDLGDQPYVWFTVTCGGEPTVGVVRGKRMGNAVRASIPRPAAAACDLELRASDTQKIDSNTLKAKVP
jgi:hypothetical protein